MKLSKLKILLPLLLLTISLSVLFSVDNAAAEDGYRMWLRYDQVEDRQKLEQYRNLLQQVVIHDESGIMSAAKEEIDRGLKGLLETPVSFESSASSDGALIIGTPQNSEEIAELGWDSDLQQVGDEGYLIRSVSVDGNEATVVAANEDIGALYGVFNLLRKIQTHQDLEEIDYQSAPKVQHRVVNHWDNLDRLVERGYAGLSLWEWGTLPEYKHPRYTDYARMNASLGINGTAINNVNADAEILTDQFLKKVAVLADIFRDYGIEIYLSIFYDSPVEIGGLDTADPNDPEVQQWWKDKTEKVYDYIPDLGGFLVKADSEGQPGPQGYGRDHAEGANVLAEALEPHGGVVFWRAFVYDPEQDDRFREAYDEFVPLDEHFNDNVVVQIKNGPIDFQPREPFSPLFGAMEETPAVLELQITQEYFGFNTHLTYKGPMYTEVLNADTYAKGEGSTVGRVLEGEVFDYDLTGMAGVINPGTDRNWTGHPFVQSSWYAYGRLAWDYTLSSEEIADEWIRMTFSNDTEVIDPVMDIMMESREAGVNYRMPLGLTHLYAQGHHYGPAPWLSMDEVGRRDWSSQYYHRATEDGIGFDRTETGSNAVEQFHDPVREIFADIDQVPEDMLLWFHHVSWDHEMESGRTLWEEMVHKYYKGVDQVREMQEKWASLEGLIDDHRFEEVKSLLKIQKRDAVRWRDSCVLYFQTYSGEPIPDEYEQPEHDLDYYIEREQLHYVPDPWYNE